MLSAVANCNHMSVHKLLKVVGAGKLTPNVFTILPTPVMYMYMCA